MSEPLRLLIQNTQSS